MNTAVIGATGRVGSEIVRGVLARGDAVSALADPAASQVAERPVPGRVRAGPILLSSGSRGLICRRADRYLAGQQRPSRLRGQRGRDG